MRRSEHIRLRLGSAGHGPNIEIVLSTEERAHLEAALEQSGYPYGLGPFLRACALRGATGYHTEGMSIADLFKAAAEAAHQGVGEWIRTVALSATGETDLLNQLTNARAAFVSGADKWEG